MTCEEEVSRLSITALHHRHRSSCQAIVVSRFLTGLVNVGRPNAIYRRARKRQLTDGDCTIRDLAEQQVDMQLIV